MPSAAPTRPTHPAADADLEEVLRHAVEVAAEALPAQGPISVFIHHNTLHAVEDLPFESAVVDWGRLLGHEPYLAGEEYRSAIARGRITDAALRRVIAGELGEADRRIVAEGYSGGQLLELILRYGLPAADGAGLRWLLEEGDALERLRADIPPRARDQILAPAGRGGERSAVRALWASAAAAAESLPTSAGHQHMPPVRLRDLLLSRTGLDIDATVHPLLIRLSAAFLDQGVGQWPMPGRNLGFHDCVMALYASRTWAIPEPWVRRFAAILAEDRREGRNAWASIRASLDALGVPPGAWPRYARATALALRGWAGMFRQVEQRPDRVPVHAPRATLGGFLAVRLAAERAAAETLARRQIEESGSLRAFYRRLTNEWQGTPVPSRQESAWQLFHLFQLMGLAPAQAERLDRAAVWRIQQFIERYPDVEARRVLHAAYEQSFFDDVLGALSAHGAPASPPPAFQVITCIDEREESFRRHLEEVDDGVETFSYPGYFGIPMAFRGVDDAHSRPLCPVSIVPHHEVREVAAGPVPGHVAVRRRYHATTKRLARVAGAGMHTLARGTFATAVAGTMTAIPLVMRVLLPHHEGRLRKHAQALVRPEHETVLEIECPAPGTGDSDGGDGAGFTVEEMAGIVAEVLEDTGLAAKGTAPLVFVMGHGSTSLNNPHESAHDCGACGGGHGGPNARAFALMANDPRVREVLCARGAGISPRTVFVGGEHNTCNDAVDLYDMAAVPPALAADLDRAQAALEEARSRNAHERSRRYDSFRLRQPPAAALQHVEARANDLAQPRPEYGHATNAICIIGPRSTTRGLFLDRRAFLTSYEPSADPDGSVLERIAAAVMPVVAGINLEYYFSTVDPAGYGCGTKLPHNVSALLGVMDGHASDLRTGLPWQMVEIHEPMRLLVVVEAPAERVATVFSKDRSIARLVANRWLHLVARDPADGSLWAWRHGSFEPVEPPTVAVPRVSSSREWYCERRGPLPFARVVDP